MKLRTVLKAVLLYITALSYIIFLAGGCESLVEDDLAVVALLWVFINVFLLYLCLRYISYKELHKLSGVDILDNVLYRQS